MNTQLHLKRTGAFGVFEVTHDVSKYTRAAFLQPGKVTKVFTRFSTQIGERGSPDTAIDAKGFAVKFYTEDGIFDFVGLNLPIFANRDPSILMDLLHSRMKSPATNQPDPSAFWDIASERPETAMFAIFLLSETAYVKSYRYIDGHAIHTFKLVNRRRQPTFAKLVLTSDVKDKRYFKSSLESLTTAGISPEYLTADLYDNIATGKFPTWTFNLQLMTYEQAKTYRYNIFDSTKLWNTTEFPLTPVGKLTLNQNPQNFFRDVEQSAFAPSRLVPGIEATPDRLFESRMFAYRDAQMYRLGVNHDQIPVNRCPYRNYDRDGEMNVGSNNDNGPNYFPNTFNGPVNNDDKYYNELPFEVCDIVDRYDTGDEDNYSQAQAYYQSLSEDEVNILANNIASMLVGAIPRIRQKVFDKIFSPISKELSRRVLAAIKGLEATLAAAKKAQFE